MTVISVEHIALRENGTPYIIGKGVKVAYVANLFTRHNWSIETIAAEHDLSVADVHAALAYYYDHKDEIDPAIKVGDDLAKQNGTSIDELRLRIQNQMPSKDE
jgi:uncharacterized protein (DUF433 family)